MKIIIILLLLLYFIRNIFRTVFSVKPVDEDGYLYRMKVFHNYGNSVYTGALDKLVSKFACSSFCVRNEKCEVITARNYDLPHRGSDGGPTGLNMIVSCEPKNGFKSVGVADVCWLKRVSKNYQKGGLKKLHPDRFLLLAAPYLCMDGINEKGLSVSVLYLDTKEGEEPVHQREDGKRTVMVTVLMRLILDSCSNVREAKELAEKYNIVNTAGMDLHVFVTDSDGVSAVLEWRHNIFSVTYTDISTNFYVGFDDAQDLYKKGVLAEKYEKRDDLLEKYRFGYGHGYGRFYTIADAINETSVMNEDRAMEVLAAVSQELTESNTSMTQYSVVYNNTQKTAIICSERDYTKVYDFKL